MLSHREQMRGQKQPEAEMAAKLTSTSSLFLFPAHLTSGARLLSYRGSVNLNGYSSIMSTKILLTFLCKQMHINITGSTEISRNYHGSSPQSIPLTLAAFRHG